MIRRFLLWMCNRILNRLLYLLRDNRIYCRTFRRTRNFLLHSKDIPESPLRKRCLLLPNVYQILHFVLFFH